jgi:hypothetical protein
VYQIKARTHIVCTCQIAVLLSVSFGLATSTAATITPTHSPQCRLTLSGTIIEADVQKFKSAIDADGFFTNGKGQDPNRDPGATLCLNSPGGSYAAAVDIADIIDSNGVTTVIDKDMSCLSACALLFMAGFSFGYEDPGRISRWLHVGGHLAFHAPFIELPPGRSYDTATVEASYNAAIVAIARFLKIANRLGGETDKI